MAGITAGELKALQWVAESSYGVMPSGAMSFGGETLDYKPEDDDGAEFINLPGSRSFGDYRRGPYIKGFSGKFLVRASSSLQTFWAKYFWGATGGLADHLDAFTAQMDVYNGTTHAYQIFNGSKGNKLKISADAGKYFYFEPQVFSQYHSNKSSKVIADIQSVTLGADAATPAGVPLTFKANQQININAGGLATWYPSRFSLTTDNHLERIPGSRVGADGLNYPVPIAIDEGTRDIIFEAEVISDGQTYAEARRLGYAITALTIPIDTLTITLSNGQFEANDYPAYRQALNRENIRMRFKSLAIA